MGSLPLSPPLSSRAHLQSENTWEGGEIVGKIAIATVMERLLTSLHIRMYHP